MSSRYLESPYFSFSILTLQPQEEKVIDIHREKPESQKYGRMNYLIIVNPSSANIEIKIDDSKEQDFIFIPAGAMQIISNEWFSKLRIKNSDNIPIDKPIRIMVKRELNEKILLQEIAEKLGALTDLKQRWKLF